MGIPYWGVRCKGCGQIHPVVMERSGDEKNPFIKPDEMLRYRCPKDDKLHEYLGKEQERFDLEA